MNYLKKTHVVLALLCAGLFFQPLHGQIGKLKGVAGKAKSKAVSKAKNDASGGAAATERLENHNKKLKDLNAAPDWGNEEYVKKYQYALGYLADEVARALGGGATDRVAGKKYEKNFTEYQATYQEKAPMTDQRVYPLEKDMEKEKVIQETFRKVVYPYSQLMKKEGQDKAMWGDADWVDAYGDFLAKMKAGIAAYRTADAANFGKVERYETAMTPLQKTYDDRKGLPAKRAEASTFMYERREHLRTMQKVQKGGFKDASALLTAVEGWDFPTAREKVAFLNEWGFTAMGDDLRPDDRRTFTMNWPGEIQAELAKQTDGALNNAKTEKYAYVQYQEALRFQKLIQAGGLLFPEDNSTSSKLAESKTLIPAKKKAYEAETFTSDFHKNNVGAIGFSATGAKGFSAKKSVTAGEKFVMTIFFDRPMALIYPEGNIYLEMSGHCDEEEDLRITLSGAELDKSYFDYVVFGDNSYADPVEDKLQEEILRELVRVKGSSKEVSFTTVHRSNIDKTQLFKGSVTFDGTNMAGIGKYDVKRVGLTDVRLADVRMPKALKTDAGVAAQMKKAFMTKYGKSDVVAVKRVVIINTDWTVRRNELTGLIISRFMDAAVAYERVDGTCRYEEARFTQSYQGGGKYGACFWDGVGDNEEMSCKNVNK